MPCYTRFMREPPTNWEIGVARSRAVRTQKALERAEGVSRVIVSIATDYGPETLAEYARIMNDECYTPSGRGMWSISLVHRYMQKGGWTPKKLRKIFFKDRAEKLYDYPAPLYAEWREAIGRAHALSAENGAWVAAISQDLIPNQTVLHTRFGVGHCVERSALATYLCTFPTYDDAEPFRSEVCAAIDLHGFEYFLSFDERQEALRLAQIRIFSMAEKPFRTLSDGWHL